jgi:hypothetical protein
MDDSSQDQSPLQYWECQLQIAWEEIGEMKSNLQGKQFERLLGLPEKYWEENVFPAKMDYGTSQNVLREYALYELII